MTSPKPGPPTGPGPCPSCRHHSNHAGNALAQIECRVSQTRRTLSIDWLTSRGIPTPTATLARDRLTERVGPANALKALQVILDLGWSPPGRMSTPDRPTPDGGCGRTLGDATELELHLAVNGEPLSDVRTECGCTP